MSRVMSEIVQIFKQVLNDVSPRVCIEKALQVKNDKLNLNGREYNLKQNVRIIAAGKGAVQMVEGAEKALGNHVKDGIASVPMGSSRSSSLKTRFYEAAEHNLPDKLSIQNTEKIFQFLESDKQNSLILFLISGGASALLCSPKDGISLDDKLHVIKLLASNGADIVELNKVRIALSKVKGGKLAQRAAPSKSISLIISDIVGGKIDKVGSAPTVQQNIDSVEIRRILESHGIWQKVPKSIRTLLEKSTKNEENPNVDNENILLCDNRVLLEAFKKNLDSNGIETTIINSELEGNAKEVGEKLADPLLQWIHGNPISDIPFNKNNVKFEESKKFAFLYGGETTVKFPENLSISNPKGGRNQEMVLSVFEKLRKESRLNQRRTNRRFYFASLGSDGQDGPTDATGALLFSEDLNSSEPVIDQLNNYLDNKNTYEFWSIFSNGNRLVKIGKTGNNLMDVQLLLFEEM